MKDVPGFKDYLKSEFNKAVKIEHKYITKPEDIVSWQFYINEMDRVFRIVHDSFTSIEYRYLDVNSVIIGGFCEQALKEKSVNIRIAEIHEIPDEALIGCRVRALKEVDSKSGLCEEHYGIVVVVDRIIGNDKPFHVYIPEQGKRERFNNIELIDPKG